MGKLVLLLLICSIALVMSGCSLLAKEEDQLEPPLIEPVKENYNLAEVKKGDIVREIKAVAIFSPAKSQELYFEQTGGRIQSIEVKVGDRVNAGQPLIQLEKGSLENSVEQQKLVLEQTKLLFDLSKEENVGDIERIRLTALDVKREELKLEELERQLRNTTLVSKMGGVVTFVDTLKSGDPVTAFQTLVTVSDPTQMQLVYETASVETLTAVQLGMDVNIKVGGQDIKGKVVQTPLTAPESGSSGTSERFGRMLVIQPDEIPENAEIGSTADIQVVIEKREQALIIPRAGLRTFMGRDFVQVLEGESRKEIDVEKGIVTATEVEIVVGLSEGQQVILNN